MRNGLIGLMAAAVVGLSFVAASADSTAPTPAPAAAAAPVSADATTSVDANKIVCKSQNAPTGSRIGARRICQTQAAWDAQQRQNELDLQHEQTRGGLFSTPAH